MSFCFNKPLATPRASLVLEMAWSEFTHLAPTLIRWRLALIRAHYFHVLRADPPTAVRDICAEWFSVYLSRNKYGVIQAPADKHPSATASTRDAQSKFNIKDIFVRLSARSESVNNVRYEFARQLTAIEGVCGTIQRVDGQGLVVY